ncbi:MAG: hypothetical protein RR224_10855 [Clostridia bacterium]
MNACVDGMRAMLKPESRDSICVSRAPSVCVRGSEGGCSSWHDEGMMNSVAIIVNITGQLIRQE